MPHSFSLQPLKSPRRRFLTPNAHQTRSKCQQSPITPQSNRKPNKSPTVMGQRQPNHQSIFFNLILQETSNSRSKSNKNITASPLNGQYSKTSRTKSRWMSSKIKPLFQLQIRSDRHLGLTTRKTNQKSIQIRCL